MKSSYLKTLFLIWSIGAIFAACGGSDDTDPPESDKVETPPILNTGTAIPVSQAECPNGTVWTWENAGEAYLLNYCTMCHSQHLEEGDRSNAPLGYDFDTPQAVQIWRASILTSISGEAANMPPTLHAPAAETNKIVAWLNCGAPAGDDRIK